MYTLESVVFIVLIALVAGASLCYLALKYFGSQEQLNKNLAEKLQQAEESHTDYQTQVTEHFIETSKRVNNLTKNYKEVHEYLASSAMKLANPNLSQNILEQANNNLPGPESIIEGQANPSQTSLHTDDETLEHSDDYGDDTENDKDLEGCDIDPQAEAASDQNDRATN